MIPHHDALRIQDINEYLVRLDFQTFFLLTKGEEYYRVSEEYTKRARQRERQRIKAEGIREGEIGKNFC